MNNLTIRNNLFRYLSTSTDISVRHLCVSTLQLLYNWVELPLPLIDISKVGEEDKEEDDEAADNTADTTGLNYHYCQLFLHRYLVYHLHDGR